MYPDYDVAISNINHKVFIEVMNKDLIQEFFTHERSYRYIKAQGIIYPVRRITFGGGVVFNEGEVWARKRRILNKIFTFDLIKSLIPTIEKIIES